MDRPPGYGEVAQISLGNLRVSVTAANVVRGRKSMSSKPTLADQTILILGGAGSMGLATAKSAALQGARPILVGRRAAALAAALETSAGAPRALHGPEASHGRWSFGKKIIIPGTRAEPACWWLRAGPVIGPVGVMLRPNRAYRRRRRPYPAARHTRSLPYPRLDDGGYTSNPLRGTRNSIASTSPSKLAGRSNIGFLHAPERTYAAI
jgi:hypothetical protein